MTHAMIGPSLSIWQSLLNARGSGSTPTGALLWGAGNYLQWGAGNYLVWGT